MHVFQIAREYRAAEADYSIVTEQSGEHVGWWTKDDRTGVAGAPCGTMDLADFLTMVDSVPMCPVQPERAPQAQSYPFRKVCLAMPSDEVPHAGRVANGGSTTYLALDGSWQEDTVKALVAQGYRPTRWWEVTAPRTSHDLPLEEFPYRTN